MVSGYKVKLYCHRMASRTVVRRLVHINRRFRPQRAFPRSALPLTSIQEKCFTPRQNVGQLRGLCAKAGEGMVINIQNEKDFEERVMNNPLPVVVDFHATWCGPCRLLGPRLESLVAGKNGKVVLAKLDVDEVDSIAMKYAINSVPTVIGFRKGEIKDKFIGLQDDDKIETFVERLAG